MEILDRHHRDDDPRQWNRRSHKPTKTLETQAEVAVLKEQLNKATSDLHRVTGDLYNTIYDQTRRFLWSILFVAAVFALAFSSIVDKIH